ncbi:MAG: class I SAM-dependent methyltransferase [Candidatus Eisenbacteria bacterium]|uniref:Class I SAM-dependent methyltransferase n=1 Tax=Eiseniibacteriota bacterium TaxID=2212470 RepID=A0A933SF04_UNCEI|nr:class I SAM-dependent methyltransferase [Candidatus Eisenbacteria bacterium]
MSGTSGTARERFERFVRWTIEKEYGPVQSRLPDGEREAFADYYKKLPKPGDEAAIRRYLRGFWRSEAGWTARWIVNRAKAIGGTPRVMDAGSGFGTYSMLYASVGSEVVGADLRPDRLDAAEKRLAFHAEQTKEKLPVKYVRADLTREWDADYDLVWVYNALSHIDPLEAFLAQTRKHLKKGGVLVVGDINGAHPEHVQRLNELRGDAVHQEYVAPDGERHAYAVERPFPPTEIRQIFESNGLKMVHHELYWGGLGALPEPVYQTFMAPLQSQWQLGHSVARRQLVVATAA